MKVDIFELDIPKEHLDFVDAFIEKNNKFPEFRELQYNFPNTLVGEFVPEHPKKDIKLKTYVEKYLGKYLNPIRSQVSKDLDISPKKPKRGTKYIASIDGKQFFRSQLEALTYNTFFLEGLANEIEVDSNRFLKTCNKVPDFIWEKKKLIIEIAGMDSEEYHRKLESARKCFGDLGYKVLIINSRQFEKGLKFVSFYKHLCDLLGFEPKQEVLDSPYQYLGYRDRKSTRLNSSHVSESRMPSSA